MTIKNLLAALALLVGTSAVVGVEAAGKDTEKSPLVIVIDRADYYPYYYRVAGKLTGPMPEVTEAVLSTMGYSVAFQEVPWARAVDLITRRQADAIAGIFHRKEREAFLHYPRHFPLDSQLSLITPAETTFTFRGDLAVLDGRDIGAVHGWSYGLFSEPLKLNRIDFADEKILLRNVARGRIGIGLGNPSSLRRHADVLKLSDRIRIHTPPIERTPLFTAFSMKPGYADVARQFSKALAAFKETSAFRDILQKHGIDTTP